MKLKLKTLQALEGSIDKWRAIVDGSGADLATRNCPLCLRFATADCTISSREYSELCPVARAGMEQCGDGPYVDWCNHHKNVHGQDHRLRVLCPECKELAQAMLNSLHAIWDGARL